MPYPGVNDVYLKENGLKGTENRLEMLYHRERNQLQYIIETWAVVPGSSYFVSRDVSLDVNDLFVVTHT